jgi:serine/threonine protein kinase
MNRVGHYEIREPLGKGGMGEVYPAFDTKLGRNVAIKILPEAFARDADRMARFSWKRRRLPRSDVLLSWAARSFLEAHGSLPPFPITPELCRC